MKRNLFYRVLAILAIFLIAMLGVSVISSVSANAIPIYQNYPNNTYNECVAYANSDQTDPRTPTEYCYAYDNDYQAHLSNLRSYGDVRLSVDYGAPSGAPAKWELSWFSNNSCYQEQGILGIQRMPLGWTPGGNADVFATKLTDGTCIKETVFAKTSYMGDYLIVPYNDPSQPDTIAPASETWKWGGGPPGGCGTPKALVKPNC